MPRRFLLISAFALFAAAASAGPVSSPIPEIDVLEYDIELSAAALDAGSIEATLAIELDARETLDRIELHIDPVRITIRSVLDADGGPLPFTIAGGTPNAHGASGARLTVHLPEPLPRGAATRVEIAYRIDVGAAHEQRGFFFDPDHDGSRVLSTRNWPYFARNWLPANDHPSDAARFRFTLRVPSGAIGIANGRRVSAEMSAGGNVFVWETSRPIPTYALQVVIGEFDSIERELCFDRDDGAPAPCTEADVRIPVAFYFPPGSNDQGAWETKIEEAENAIAYFSSAFGVYAFAKAGFVDAPHPFNMESATLITLIDPGAAVHEAVHHWWGNAVQIRSWGDFWISEGITTYFTGFFDEITIGINTACSETGRKLDVTADQDPLDLFTNDPYCVGAAAIHDFRERLAASEGVHSRSPEAIAAFLDVFRRTYEALAFEATGTFELAETLERATFASRCARGLETDWSEVETFVGQWRDAWFTGVTPSETRSRRPLVVRPEPRCSAGQLAGFGGAILPSGGASIRGPR